MLLLLGGYLLDFICKNLQLRHSAPCRVSSSRCLLYTRLLLSNKPIVFIMGVLSEEEIYIRDSYNISVVSNTPP